MLLYTVASVIAIALSIYGYKRFTAWKTFQNDQAQLATAWPKPLPNVENHRGYKFVRITLKNGESRYGAFDRIGVQREWNQHKEKDHPYRRHFGIYFIMPSGVSGGGWDCFLAGSKIERVENAEPPTAPYWL